jgi:hypothetical protein
MIVPSFGEVSMKPSRFRIPFELAAAILVVYGSAAATTIHVPADQPTIQAAINAATNGDTVLVSAGTYPERINFLGKAITVRGISGRRVTFIDGGGSGTVVTFNSGETLSSVLRGFTIFHGVSANALFSGGGVTVDHSSPTIRNNIIESNIACADGGGLEVEFGAPLIYNNIIWFNSQTPSCGGGAGGGGISLGLGTTGAQIVKNKIMHNSWRSGPGGGIVVSGGSPLITNNVISGNHAESPNAGVGGGIASTSFASPIIVQNLFFANVAGAGGGIYLSPSSGSGAIVVSNTISNNKAAKGSAIFIGGDDTHDSQFFNNLLVSDSGLNAVDCDGTSDPLPPVFMFNDAFSHGGIAVEGTCSGDIGINGNISVDPLFGSERKHRYQLDPGSPAIDAGDNSAPNVPPTDLAGRPRVVDGNGDGNPVIDMGVYEFQ